MNKLIEELKQRIEDLKKLMVEFRPYNDAFDHLEWLVKVNKVLDREIDEDYDYPLCTDYFYNDEVLDFIIKGEEKYLAFAQKVEKEIDNQDLMNKYIDDDGFQRQQAKEWKEELKERIFNETNK